MGNAVGCQQGAFLMATRVEAPLTTTEGNEYTIVVAVVAADASESEVQVAAAEKFASHLTENRAPATVALLVTPAIGTFDSGLDEPVERRLPRLPGTVNGCDLGRQTDHEGTCFPFDKERAIRERMLEWNEL